MSLLTTVFLGWVAVAVVMAGLWLVQRGRGNAGIVDVAWSIATGVLGAWFAFAADGLPARRLIVGSMVVIWGLRLGLHLWRRVSREREDGRYTHLRQQWGDAADRHLFLFFQVQALWAVMFATPMLAAAGNAAPIGVFDLLGIALWLVSISGESIADAQLARFRARPGSRGRVCRDGLWRYSRHPNYFFEWVHWWAYVCLAIGSPLWWIPVVGVVMMFLFLTRVTGIPPTEAQAVRTRGEAYRAYQRTTSAFFPWPPAEDRR